MSTTETELVHGLAQYRRGCRCDICRRACADDRRAYRNGTHPPSQRARKHGIAATYNAGCRCDPCRESGTERSRLSRQRRRERLSESSFKHGASAYSNWGCRCQICTAGHREKMARQYRERRSIA